MRDQLVPFQAPITGTVWAPTDKADRGYRIYEIKPYQSPRACIRDAIGQLLEYAHWQNEFSAIELIVVGPRKIDTDAKQYLELLCELYQLPISYLQVAV